MSKVKHGLYYHRVYKIYYGMLTRCYDENNEDYYQRGIEVCDRWRDSFEDFVSDMGLPPSNIHQIDRIDNDGNYEPSNCRWVTPKENNNNRRSSNLLTYDGKTQSVTLWADETGIGRSTISRRINQLGWSIEDALTISALYNRRGGRKVYHLL